MTRRPPHRLAGRRGHRLRGLGRGCWPWHAGGGRARALRRCPAAARWLAVCAGLVEAAALLALARGGQDGQIAVTAAVSNLYPVIPLATGVLWFRERLTARQVLGAGIITAGSALLSIA